MEKIKWTAKIMRRLCIIHKKAIFVTLITIILIASVKYYLPICYITGKALMDFHINERINDSTKIKQNFKFTNKIIIAPENFDIKRIRIE